MEKRCLDGNPVNDLLEREIFTFFFRRDGENFFHNLLGEVLEMRDGRTVSSPLNRKRAASMRGASKTSTLAAHGPTQILKFLSVFREIS